MRPFKMNAKTFLGLEEILAKELTNLGANDIQIKKRLVSFTGDKAMLYRANLYCRTALRILIPIATFKAKNDDDLYQAVKRIEWEKYITTDKTFAINSTVYSENFTHSQFVTYRVKDAIVDHFMQHTGNRPSVSTNNPDLQLNIHISHNDCTLSLDSSGESLHRRGYRQEQTQAPINEVLAAGMLLMADWGGQSNFIDPMCGSGTLLIEAALIALGIPPGIFRKTFAFEKWNNFDKELFREIYDNYEQKTFPHKIYGADISGHALKIAQENINAAGISKYIELRHQPIAEFEPIEGKTLMVTNPPYGKRLHPKELDNLYTDLGTLLKHKFAGNDAWVISQQPYINKIGLRPSKKIKLKNGDLDCDYWKFEVFDGKRKAHLAEQNPAYNQ